MGFVNKNFTLVTSLTQKGREYFLAKNKNKFNIKFFALSDSDTNYIIASSTTSPFVHNSLKLGYVPNLSGYNDSTIDCLRYIANGIVQRYSVGGSDDCSVVSEFINPFTNELSCDKVQLPIIYPFTSTLTTDMVNSLSLLFPTGKDNFGNDVILFNEKDTDKTNFNFNVFLGLSEDNVNTTYIPYGLETYNFLLDNLNDVVISIDNEHNLLNINNNLPNRYKFDEGSRNITRTFMFSINKNYYTTLNYGLNDLLIVEYNKDEFIEGIINSLPSTEIPLEKKIYVVKGYRATTVSIDNNDTIDLGDIRQYLTNGVGSIKIMNNFLLNSKSPNGLEKFDLNISSSDNNITNLRFDETNKNNLGLTYGVGENIIKLDNNDIKFGFDESTIPNGAKLNLDLQLKLANPNKFVFVDSVFNSKTFKLSYNKKKGVYFGGNIMSYNTTIEPNPGDIISYILILSNLNIYVESTNVVDKDTNVLIDVTLEQHENTPLHPTNLRLFINNNFPTLEEFRNGYDNNIPASDYDIPTIVDNRSYNIDSFYEIIKKDNIKSDNKLHSTSIKTPIRTDTDQKIGLKFKNYNTFVAHYYLDGKEIGGNPIIKNFDGYVDINAKYEGDYSTQSKPNLFDRPAFMFDFPYPSDENLLKFNNKIPFDIVYTIKPSGDYEILDNNKITITVNPIIEQPKYLHRTISSNGGNVGIGSITTNSGSGGSQSNTGVGGAGGNITGNRISGKDIKTMSLSSDLTLGIGISGEYTSGEVIIYKNNVIALDFDSSDDSKKYNKYIKVNQGDILDIRWSASNFSNNKTGSFYYNLGYSVPNPLYIPPS